MTQIVLDANAVRKLTQVVGAAQIVDTSGNVLGVFRTSGQEAFDRFQVPYTADELRQFEAEAGGRPLEEILRDLQAGK